ncbi:MAG TPA: NADP-dependent phosphogluconate dehydrogenase [Chitinophagaceae bacterium]|nr:NADP-dependent phosphogluconate dehydrogenase [Chitinophagaceae bacterium]
MAGNTYDFGMIGLGVMGRNLLLNMADHGFQVIGFDTDNQKTTALQSAAGPDAKVKGASSLAEMVNSLSKPRRIMMLVPAGKPVDAVIASLLALVEPGDIVIDGGNSHYTDTLRRVLELHDKGIHFMGMGISGGEKGARTGPSMMPGGDPAAWQSVKPILEAVAARAGTEQSPCVAHMGRDAAGHYVKMVHNGIEYAIMQLISETYMLLRHGAGLDNDELHKIYAEWNTGDLQSFLMEITADIFLTRDDRGPGMLLDQVSDQAGSKGTGKWTSQDAMDLPVPVNVIDTAVSMRELSGFPDQRLLASGLYAGLEKISYSRESWIELVRQSLHFATVISYAQGLTMLQSASKALNMDVPLPEVARIWRGGCIIRSALLDLFYPAFLRNPKLKNLLLDADLAKQLQGRDIALRQVIAEAARTGYPVAGLMSALSYFDNYRLERMPTNLIQAQRDYFGAHTYQRTDIPGTFHTEWEP